MNKDSLRGYLDGRREFREDAESGDLYDVVNYYRGRVLDEREVGDDYSNGYIQGIEECINSIPKGVEMSSGYGFTIKVY